MDDHTSPHRSINPFSEHINVTPLSEILSGELKGSHLENCNLLEFLFPDTVLGFSVDEAITYLETLGAFARPTTTTTIAKTGDLTFHDGVRCQVESEASMVDYLNHIIMVLQNRYPHFRSVWAKVVIRKLHQTHTCNPSSRTRHLAL